jgi:phage/plasmid-associated DNA primase
MHLIPFIVTIPENERDQNLPEKLKPEWPGIFNWAIEGCLEWQATGLKPPQAVTNATNAYLAAEDAFNLWREDCTETDPNAWELSAVLWHSWKRWAENAGEFVGSQKRFAQTLQDRGFKPGREGGTGRRGYYGTRITRHEQPDIALSLHGSTKPSVSANCDAR